MSLFLKEALNYASQGYPVFPLREHGKEPLLKGGFHNATTDRKQITAWWMQYPRANIGIPCGKDTFCVIDQDYGGGGGEETYQAFKEEYGAFPDTLMQKTGGGGIHYLFKPDPRVGCTQSKVGKNFDTKGNDKGYIVVYPSVHKTGNLYQWLNRGTPLANIPEWFVELLNKPISPKKKVRDITPFDSSSAFTGQFSASENDILARAREYLRKCDPAVSGQGGHSKLLWACTAMVRGFLLDKDTVYNLLAAEYNPRCVPPWVLSDPNEDREFRRKIDEGWRSTSQREGWLIDEFEREQESLKSMQIEQGKKIQKALLKELEPKVVVVKEKKKEKKKVKKSDILNPCGFVGDLTSYITNTALKPQPMLALGNVLAFCGALVGRKVRNEWDLRTNLYALGVAESCAGKEHSRRMIKAICIKAGMSEKVLGGEDITSDAAIASRLTEEQSQLFMFDEIGYMIVSVKDPLASSTRKTIVPYLMKLTGASNTMLLGKEYANDIRKDVIQPNVCVYGTTVPDVLYNSLSSTEIRDGLLGRLLIFRSRNDFPAYNDEGSQISEIPRFIVERLRWWAEYKPKAPDNVSDIKKYSGVFQVTIPTLPEATEIFLDLRSKILRKQKKCISDREPYAPLWGRVEEHARKIALIISALDCDHPEGARIAREHAEYACKLVEIQMKDFVHTIRFAVADTNQERCDKTIHNLILKSEEKGLRHRDLARGTRNMHSKQRDEALRSLVEGEYIVKIMSKNSRGFRYFCPPYGLNKDE